MKLNGNIELAPLIGIADVVVDITATGTTLRENRLRIVEDVLASTARFVGNPAAVRTDPRVIRARADTHCRRLRQADSVPYRRDRDARHDATNRA